MQRSSVDLPEPDAPMRQTTSCSATVRSTPSMTTWAPNAFVSPAISMRPGIAGASQDRLRAALAVALGDQSVKRASGMLAARNSTAAPIRLE